jgi:hypothetical protein
MLPPPAPLHIPEYVTGVNRTMAVGLTANSRKTV